MPGHFIEHIILRDIQFIVSGGGTIDDANKTDLNEYTLEVLDGWWPEFHLVGTLPATGIYGRHLDGLYIDNFHIETKTDDARPGIVFDDVRNYHTEAIFLNQKIMNVISR